MTTTLRRTLNNQLFPHWNEELPKHLRKEAWKYRAAYLLFNILILFWVFNLSGTGLWIKSFNYLAADESQADVGNVTRFLAVVGLSWIAYFSTQCSDPGYLTKEKLRKVGFDAETGSTVTRSCASLMMTGHVSIEDEGEEKSEDNIYAAEEGTAPSRESVMLEEVELTSTSTRKNRRKRSYDDVAWEDEEEEKMGAESKEAHISSESDRLVTRSFSDDFDEDESEARHIEEEVRARLRFGMRHLPLRARWCRQSRRFVAKYDHFCTVLGTCVGERNHCRFWWFLLFQSAAAAWAVTLVMTGIEYRLSWSNWFQTNAQHVMCALILWSVFLTVFSLLGFHTFLAASNMTSFELMRGSRIDYLADFDECDLPFSQGLSKNLRLFCCGQTSPRKNDWLPILWAPPERFNRNSRDVCANIWENRFWRCC
eukprot:g1306.t1